MDLSDTEKLAKSSYEAIVESKLIKNRFKTAAAQRGFEMRIKHIDGWTTGYKFVRIGSKWWNRQPGDVFYAPYEYEATALGAFLAWLENKEAG